MKKITMSLICLLAVGFAFSQTIPNSGFEDWTGGQPTGWSTFNSTVSGGATQTNDAYAGSSAVKLQTKNLLFQPVPGTVTLGTITISGMNASITGGIPFTFRPDSLTGYYKYTPSGSDRNYVGLALFKYNTTTNNADTLAKGFFGNNTSVSAYTRFSFPVEYLMSGNPDTLNVLGMSSMAGYTTNGSIMFLDELSFVYNTTTGSIATPLNAELRVAAYPNPTADVIYVENPFNSETEIYVHDINGRLVFQTHCKTKGVEINMAEIGKGTYFVQAVSNQQKAVTRVIVR